MFNKEDKGCIAGKIALVLLFASTGSLSIWKKIKEKQKLINFIISSYIKMDLQALFCHHLILCTVYILKNNENDILLKKLILLKCTLKVTLIILFGFIWLTHKHFFYCHDPVYSNARLIIKNLRFRILRKNTSVFQ